MNYKQIISDEINNDSYPLLHSFYHRNYQGVEINGQLYKVIEQDSEYDSEQIKTTNSIVEVVGKNKYFRVSIQSNSWDGEEEREIKEVAPKEKIITVWEKI